MTPRAIDIDINTIIPHRDQMQLIDEIIEIGGDETISCSTVTNKWPLFNKKHVQSIVLIELVAQTAAAAIGWKKKQRKDDDGQGKGWIVGIKQAEFFIDKIPVNAIIETTTCEKYNFENLTEILGITKIGSKVVGRVYLQVVESDL